MIISWDSIHQIRIRSYNRLTVIFSILCQKLLILVAAHFVTWFQLLVNFCHRVDKVVRYNVTSKPFLSQNASFPIASSSYIWFNIAGGLKKSELRETREIAKIGSGE